MSMLISVKVCAVFLMFSRAVAFNPSSAGLPFFAGKRIPASSHLIVMAGVKLPEALEDSSMKRGSFVISSGRVGVIEEDFRSELNVNQALVYWLDDGVEDFLSFNELQPAPEHLIPLDQDCRQGSIVNRLVNASVNALPHAVSALQQIDAIYEGGAEDARYVSVDGDRVDKEVKAALSSGKAATYGEILPRGIVHALVSSDASAGMRYYDLGSGFGKTVLLAGLFGLKASGIELSSERHTEACKALDRAEQLGVLRGEVNLVHGNFLEQDFSDADVVLINCVAYPDALMADITSAASGLKRGTKVVTYKPLAGDKFKIRRRISIPVSWKEASSYYIQEVVH